MDTEMKTYMEVEVKSEYDKEKKCHVIKSIIGLTDRKSVRITDQDAEIQNEQFYRHGRYYMSEEEYNERAESQKSVIDGLSQEVKTKEQMIAELEAKLAEKDEHINRLETAGSSNEDKSKAKSGKTAGGK